MADQTRLTGDEPFTEIGATVRDFWAYTLSNLKANATRGYLAEFLVAKAVGAIGLRIEWDAFDVLTPDGTTIEVKTSGHTQTWDRTKPAVLNFGGLPGGSEGTKVKRSWSAADNAMIDAHVAHVYVFCVHTTTQDQPYDGLDVGAWDFYVLPGIVVEGTKQKSMMLSTVIRLGGTRLRWSDLAGAIKDAAASNKEAVDEVVAPTSLDDDGARQLQDPRPKTEAMTDDLCVHEMLPGTCGFCSPGNRPSSTDTSVVHVSPEKVGHLPGCMHKGEDEDYTRWGEIHAPGAWQDLRNGRRLLTDHGAVIGMAATRACKSCIART
ncbi:hypothetical protein ACIGB8_01435 [Promicromonospora sukumoe]|uniref:hypothetical protein n=1 Tax=Promicromonospora sukumoe TaxID=88382 RepID=UPI0037CAECB8